METDETKLSSARQDILRQELMDALMIEHNLFYLKLADYWDFLGGPVVKNLPSNARDAGLIPAWGPRIPRAMEPIRPGTTTRPSLSHNDASQALTDLNQDPMQPNKCIIVKNQLIVDIHHI